VEIPAGYTGWVEIQYSARCARPPTLADGRKLLRLNPSGKLCVGSPWKEGVTRDDFYYVRPGGGRRLLTENTPGTGMIWARTTGLGGDRTERFFVGTERQLRTEYEADRAHGDDPTRRPLGRRSAR
jgi:hypothetical protein